MLRLDALNVSRFPSGETPLCLLRRQASALGRRVRSATVRLSCGEPDLLRKLQPAWVGSPALDLHLPTGVGPVGWLTRAALETAIGELRAPRIVVCGHSHCALEELSLNTGETSAGAGNQRDPIANARRAQSRLHRNKARVAEMVHEICQIWREPIGAGELEVCGLFHLPESGVLLRFDPWLDGFQVVEG